MLLLCIFAPFLIIIYIVLACSLPEQYTLDETLRENDVWDDKKNNDGAKTLERRAELVKIACYSAIAGALVLTAADIAFGQKATFTHFVRYMLLTGGILLFLSALFGHNTPGGKKTKITVSVVLILLSAFSLLGNVSIFVATASSIKTSINYTWPLLVAALGLTILFRGKTLIKIMWIALAVLIIAYAVLINMGIHLF